MTNSGTRTSASRLAVEGIVIVVSILLAFGIEAWWASTQDHDREVGYLGQIESDLESTLENNARFGSLAEMSEMATARLFRSYYQETLPPSDSLEAWWAGLGMWVVQPRLGTIRALVATGDLELVRDDSLRVAISNYLTEMAAFEDFEADGARGATDALAQLTRHVDPIALRVENLSEEQRESIVQEDAWSALPTGPVRELRKIDLTRVVRDSEVHRVLGLMHRSQETQRIFRGLMCSESEDLLARVRRAQGAR